MKNKSLIILPLLFISMLAYLPGSFHVARATLTGNVCLQPSGTPGCPGAPVLFASSGGTLMVDVNIVGSDPLNGFDVSIATDPTTLVAMDAVNGAVLSSPTVLLKCLDGVLVTGSVCASQDGPGVLHFAEVQTGPTVSGTGTLFTAVYHVAAATPGIPMDFAVDAVDCASSSVSGGVCVSISNGTTSLNSETTTGASFSNLSDFSIDCSPPSLALPVSTPGSCVLTLTSFGGFTDFIDLTATPAASPPFPSIPPADLTVLLPAGGTVSTTLSVLGAAVSGSYTASVLASADMILQPAAISHTVSVPVVVAPPDFTISASPSSLNIAPGSSDVSTITVGSISGFSGSVSLSAVSAPLGASFATNPVTAPGTSILTISVPGGTPSGMYTVTVTGTGSGSHSVAITVNVGEPDFSLAASPNALVIPRVDPVRTGASTLNIASINNFAATLTITVSISGPISQVTPPATEIPGAAITTTLSSSTVVLSSGGSASPFLIATVLKASTGTGLNIVTVTVSGGSKTHTVVIDVWVTDFTLTLRDPVITLINDSPTILAHPVQTVMKVRFLGAPNQSITLGFDTAARAPLLNAAYTYSPSTGRRINDLPLTDTTRNRCFMAVYDSSNNLITPTLNGAGQVVSFLAPVVHINGDADGDPPDFNGCRFDSGGGQSNFGVGPSPGVNTGDPLIDDFPMPTVEVLPGTPNGMYTAKVCLLGAIVYNCVDLTINLVAPPKLPYFNQWAAVKPHTVHLASGTNAQFRTGVTNNDTSTTIYVQVVVSAVDGIGDTATASSGVIAIAPGASVQNILVNMDVSGLTGVVHYSGTIQYGVAPVFLTENSALSVVTKSTGSFLVTP